MTIIKFVGFVTHLSQLSARPKYLAGMYLMLRSYLHIPAHTPKVHGDINCKVREEMTVFAYRTHTHKLGEVVTG